MEYENIRESVLNAFRYAVAQGLMRGNSGNIALRDVEDDVVAITPSGIPCSELSIEDISVVDLNGRWLYGSHKPSSEVPMHTAVMRARPDVKATVHTHSMYATIMAMGEHPVLEPITPPQCEFTPIGVVDFAIPGSNDVAQKVVDTLGFAGHVVLIKNHGMLACGGDMQSAMHAAIYTEEMARTACCARTLGVYEPMPETAVKKMQLLIAASQAV